MVTTAEHAHENRAKGDVEGSVNQDEDEDEGEDEDEDYDNERNKAKNKRTKNSKKMSASSNIGLGIEIWRTIGALRVRGRWKVFENVDLAMGQKRIGSHLEGRYYNAGNRDDFSKRNTRADGRN